jgi:prostaglandin-endoperoxide synthase 2
VACTKGLEDNNREGLMSTLPQLHNVTEALPRIVGRLGLKPPPLPEVLARQLPRIIEPLASLPPVRRLASKLVINYYSYATSLRPRALSMASDYTTWSSLTDRKFTGRHLPPAEPETIAALPSEIEVNALYRRDSEIKATDTSVWFMFFAQWFTDSFLRTSRADFRQNTSTQEIDLCQIYGLGADQTRMLRSLSGGRLKSQMIDGEEFPVFLFQERGPGEPLAFKSEFHGLFDERFMIDTILSNAPDDRKDSVFAVGLEHGNSTIGNTILNTLFLREHNRIAGVLKSEHPEWDDDRLFETTRCIMIVLLLKLVVEEYIRHIGPFDFAIEAVPFIADEERWNRPNWIAIEFNLLYRWHSLIPDAIGEGAKALTWQKFLNNNPLVISRGLESLVAQCSQEHAGRIGLLNTPRFLVDRSTPDHPSLEERTIALMRQARLRSFNDYRESYGLSRLRSFTELTSDPTVRERLEALYNDDIESLEWYVGIFAEEYPDYLMMGELLTTMVANDAFTQALSNPLLARNVFNEATFSAAGMKIIRETSSLQQILARNSQSPEDVVASFDC